MILLKRKDSPFIEILLNMEMQSGIALPLINTGREMLGVLILNSMKEDFYNRKKFSFLDSLIRLAGAALHNSRKFQELKNTLKLGD